jgi:hypothetical protein
MTTNMIKATTGRISLKELKASIYQHPRWEDIRKYTDLHPWTMIVEPKQA